MTQAKTVLVTESKSDQFRAGVTEAIRILLAERGQFDQPIAVDLAAAKTEAEAILAEHGAAIAELTVNGAFDLIEMQRGSAYDVGLYNSVLRKLDSAALAAEAEANAAASTELIGRIKRRKALVQRLSHAAQVVVRGVLMTAIVSGLGAAGVPVADGSSAPA